MFSIENSHFNKELYLTKRVSNDVINESYIQYFDNDGFELSYLECEYYRENGVNLKKILNHSGDQQPWITCSSEKFKVDHSMILQRWGFQGEAKEQLIQKRTEYPQLNKYLKLEPKWGLDFALEYYNNEEVVEALHIELDYRDYDEALEAKKWFEVKIVSTDWDSFVESLIKDRAYWENLPAMQQNDWKAAYWGLNRAETTYKAFV